MPQLSAGHVWSCWEPSGTRGRGGQDGREENEMITREVEERDGREWRWMRLHWRNWPNWSQCLVPIAAAVCWFVLEESVSLTEAVCRLLLAGLMCVVTALCASALRFLLGNGQKVKQHLPYNDEVIVRKTAENQQQASINPQQDAGHLESLVNVLADGLVVSLLHEPLPDPSEPHIRGLLSRLQAVSQTFRGGACEEEKERNEKCVIEERVNQIRSYLQDRMSSLRSLLQVQRGCEVSVCAVQSALQKRWALLEELHTRVTLSPDSTQEAHDPHAVLTDTENLFAELGQFKSKVQQCRTQLETNINLLQALRSSHQGLAGTFGTSIDSKWTKELLQSNTDLFSEIQEDFMSLEQQTSNFVIHLRGLNDSEEKESRSCQDYQAQTSLSSPLPVVPVYVASPQSHSDPDTDPESPGASQKTHSKMSPFHMLCGRKRRKPST
ncbi:uncharacterized protein si:ch211-151h10.2 [Rhinichthys klamathensis goyatoka]|uniref:uncharacterized protein si:ch211-151h10.2 n=1 Tax=Rhinichthys klamathensis goyatoka TaxID=3034132 RepID=UPI0024B4F7C6|nr:uncharacterized protein si:ch211-151h10.2 [Rhinichthys klamathensis goyatoka]